MSNFKLVNLWQTNEERRGKYWLVRSLGGNSYHARRLMDWRLSKIERFYNLTTSNKQQPELGRLQQHIASLVSPIHSREPGT